MKKIIVLLTILTITACSLNNNPNSKIEELLGNYQKLDKSIILTPDTIANDKNLSTNLKEKYNSIIKKQYQNISYEIKDTIEDGNQATVIVEIKVLNYKKIINKVYKNEDNIEEYHKKLIKELNKANETVTYTITFTLTKNEKGTWEIDPITNEIENKLLGIY